MKTWSDHSALLFWNVEFGMWNLYEETITDVDEIVPESLRPFSSTHLAAGDKLTGGGSSICGVDCRLYGATCVQ